jgi:hypothetical protein
MLISYKMTPKAGSKKKSIVNFEWTQGKMQNQFLNITNIIDEKVYSL